MATKQKTVKTKDLKGLKEVQEHYLDYPYPLRNPEDDKTRLLKVYGDYLGEINHWLLRARKTLKRVFVF